MKVWVWADYDRCFVFLRIEAIKIMLVDFFFEFSTFMHVELYASQAVAFKIFNFIFRFYPGF